MVFRLENGLIWPASLTLPSSTFILFLSETNIYLSVYDKYRKGRAILSRYTVVDQKVEISVAPQIILLSSQTINTLSNLQTTKTKYIADFEIYIFLVTLPYIVDLRNS